MAEAAGIDFLLPIGRWKGYGGDTDYQGSTFETITWATGLLAKTERITVFGTVHAPLFPPIIAAKQMVTADHVGEGRFGLNIVCGWNEGEFEMFGVAAERSRTALRARPRMDRRAARDLDEERFRFRRRLLPSARRAREAETVGRDAPADDECRRVARRQSVRDSQLPTRSSRPRAARPRKRCRSKKPRATSPRPKRKRTR